MTRKKKIKIGLGIFLLLMLSFHFFVRWKAAQILSSIVSNVTNNKYYLKTSKVRLNYFTVGIRADNVVLEPVDSANKNKAVQFTADRIVLDLDGFSSLLFNRALDIDEIRFVNPSITIPATGNTASKDTSEFVLHDQLLAVQSAVNRMINSLRMEQFRIDNASVKIFTDTLQHNYFAVNRLSLHMDHLFSDVSANKKEGKIKLNGAIHLWLDHPQIHYPDSAVSVAIEQFDWQSDVHKFSIKNIAFSKRRSTTGGDSSHIQLHEVRVSHLDWNAWANSGKVIIDSINAYSGDVYFEKLDRDKPQRQQDKVVVNKTIISLLSPMQVHYLSIRKINSSALTTSNNLALTGAINGDSLAVVDFDLDIKRKDPVRLKALKLDIKQFRGKDLNDTWETSFSVFRIDKDSIVLTDYLLQSQRASRFGTDNMFKIPRLVLNGFSLPDLVAGRLIAKEMRMENPVILLNPAVLAASGKNKTDPTYKGKTLRDRFPFLSVETFVLSNASVIIYDNKTGSARVEATNVDGRVDIDKLMKAGSVAEYITSGQAVNAGEVKLHLPQAEILVNGVKVSPQSNALFIQAVTTTLPGNAGTIALQNVALQIDSANKITENTRSLLVKTLNADNANINIDLDKLKRTTSSKTASERNAAPFVFSIGKLNLAGGKLNVKKGANTIVSALDDINMTGINNRGGIVNWTAFDINAHQLSFKNKTIAAITNNVRLQNNQPSALRGTRLRVYQDNAEVVANIPLIKIDLPVNALPGKNLDMLVHSINAENPSVGLLFHTDTTNTQVHIDGKHIGVKGLKLEQQNGEKLKWQIAGLDIKTGESSVSGSKGMDVVYHSLDATLTDIRPHAVHKTVGFNVEDLSLKNITYSRQHNENRMDLHLDEIKVVKTGRITAHKDSLLRMVYEHPGVMLNGADIVMDNPTQLIRFYNVSANLARNSFSLDSFTLRGKLPRDSAFALQPFEKDIFTITTGKINAIGVSTIQNNLDSGFAIRKINVDSLNLKVERDKRRPADTVSYRPLLARMIQRIPFLISVDTIALKDGLVWHNLIEKKRGEEGSIFFTNINGWIGDVRNYNINDADTLRIRVNAKLMGKGNLYMRFRQSYKDTLQTFLLYARMGQYSMAELNRILTPLVRVKIDRGQIDTLWLDVKANDLFAFGNMEMDYRNLKVALLNKQHEERGFFTWLANKFVRNKSYKKSKVYVARLQNKAIFNYWGKISLSGLLTNVGIRTDRKYRKLYKSALEKYKLPPHLLDDDE